MKIFNLVSNIVLIVAFVVMWALHPKSGASEDGTASTVMTNEGNRLPLAYVNIDSVVMNYQEAIDLNEELMSQQEDARTNLTAKARNLEEEMVSFQRKVENNGFLTQERAQSEQQRLIAKQQQLEQEQQKISNELGLKQQDLNEQVMTAITDYVEEYNKDGKFEMIFTQTAGIGRVMYSKSVYNMTAEVLEPLNEQYTK